MTLIDLDGAGVATSQRIPFDPLRKVRTLRGKLEELIAHPRSTDLVKVVLTDQMRLIDPMKRLREAFPNACELVYARDEAQPDGNAALPAQVEVTDPLQVIRDFVELVRAEGIIEAELELVTAGLHDLQNEGIAA